MNRTPTGLYTAQFTGSVFVLVPSSSYRKAPLSCSWNRKREIRKSSLLDPR